MRNRTNQKGFAVVEAILVVLIIGLIAGTGYYVWHTSQQTKATLEAASKSAQSSPQKVTKKKAASDNLTATWKAYHSAEGRFTVKYPADWVQPTNQEACGDFLKRDLEVGPTTGSVIKCASDGTISQVSISSQAGDTRKNPANTLDTNRYKLNTQGAAAEADGVQGTAIAGEAINQGDEAGLGSLPNGTEVVIYVFYKNDTTYIARYTQYPSDAKTGPVQNQLSNFNLMVAQTLKFE